MKLAAASTRPSAGRTEREVAAEVIMCLVEAKLISVPNPQKLADVAAAARVPVSMLQTAWQRQKSRGYLAPLDQPTARSTPAPTPTPVAASAGPGRRANGVAPTAPAPAKRAPASVHPFWTDQQVWDKYRGWGRNKGGKQCAKCKKRKPVEQFDVKDRRIGTLKSFCRPCTTSYQRSRYLSVDVQAKLDKVGLRFTVTDGYEKIRCTRCKRPLVEGDEVCGETTLAHLKCPT